MKIRVINAIMLLFLLLVVLPVVLSSDFDSEIGILVERTSELYSKGLNVTIILEKLNHAIALYEEGSVEEASVLLREVESFIEDMSITASSVYLVNMVKKVVTIIVLAAIPVIVYFLLPRLYLYVWYKTRRKWIVAR